MTSNQRIELTFSGGSGNITYTIAKNSVAFFTGRVFRSGSGSVTVDITDVLTPFVTAPEIRLSSQSFSSLTATFTITATGATPSANSITVDYLNDYIGTTIGTAAPTEYAPRVFGQPWFAYSTRTSWTYSASPSAPCSDTHRYAVLWTNRLGMPESIPVKATVTSSATWEGVKGTTIYAGSQHGTRPLKTVKNLSFSCHTPIIGKSLIKDFVRSLSQAERVYLYSIDDGELMPMQTPSIAEPVTKLPSIEFTLQSAW